MKKPTFDNGLFLFVMLAGMSVLFGQEKKIYEMSNAEIDQLLTTVSAQNLTITDRIGLYSEKFLGMPYNLNCTGDGPYALYEPWPLVNFKATNCMAFCEHVLALSISDSWDNFFNNLQQIRYKDGIIGMRSRNHYTMVDWLPENNWLIEHVSDKVGGRFIKQATRTISHRQFFESKGITDLRYIKPDRTITLGYVPKEDLQKVGKNIHNGDILVLIFADKTDIFAAHMVIAVVKNGQILICESSSAKKSTIETPFAEWSASVASKAQYVGVSFLRVRDELNTPGRIIRPCEITGLKRSE